MRIPGEHAEHYRRFRLLAQTLDAAMRIPGTKVPVGLDFVLGLVPGIGDFTAGGLGWYGIWVAQRMGAPRSVVLRMAGNIALDTIVGSVPLLGELFDLGFRSNLRNLALLDRWLADPRGARRSSRALIVALGLGLAALTAAGIYATVLLVGALVRLASGA